MRQKTNRSERSLDHKRRRSRVALLLSAILAAPVIAGTTGGCNDLPAPNYFVQDKILRLVPETDSVGEDGGPVYVLVELTRPTTTQKAVIVYARAEGATIATIPGPVLCRPSDAADAADDGTADAASDGSSQSGRKVDPDATIIPFAALLEDTARSVRETGYIVEVPTGGTDVLVVASAYEHDESAAECFPASEQLIATAAVRLKRTNAKPNEPDASEAGTSNIQEAGADAGSSDAAANDGAGSIVDASDGGVNQ